MSIVFQTCDLCDAHKHDDSGAFRVLPHCSDTLVVCRNLQAVS